MKTVITYGTYDLLHQGHINLLRRVLGQDYSTSGKSVYRLILLSVPAICLAQFFFCDRYSLVGLKK